MFESLSDAALIDAMSQAGRAESAAVAARLGCIGELDARRTVELAETMFWRTDPFEEVVAEISAALAISKGRAGAQIVQARGLRKMPIVAAQFASGAIDYRIVSTIINRTANVTDEAWPALDAALAARAPKWWRLSEPKLKDRIDHVIATHDPDAVRIPPKVDNNRYVDIAPTDPGMAGIWANLHASDAATIDQRLDALARTVCDNDPRTHAQRRADACGPLGRLQDWMPCLCGSEDCPVATTQQKATDVVIHLLAEQSTLDGTSDQPGYLPGFGIQPAQTVRDLAATAKRTPVAEPDDEPEPGYRPSTALAEFVRWRDLTCRWPGCDQPAARTDIDHTTPHPAGPTHPSNTKLYCRQHHLVKTFCTGWSDRQYPDGTVEFTTPTGHVYRTEPHGAALFPILGQSTGDLVMPEIQQPGAQRAVMMPKRRQTRAQDQADRINTERRQRAELNNQLAEQQRQQREWLTTHSEPPPF